MLNVQLLQQVVTSSDELNNLYWVLWHDMKKLNEKAFLFNAKFEIFLQHFNEIKII